jgi:hypothetical protein
MVSDGADVFQGGSITLKNWESGMNLISPEDLIP